MTPAGGGRPGSGAPATRVELGLQLFCPTIAVQLWNTLEAGKHGSALWAALRDSTRTSGPALRLADGPMDIVPRGGFAGSSRRTSLLHRRAGHGEAGQHPPVGALPGDETGSGPAGWGYSEPVLNRRVVHRPHHHGAVEGVQIGMALVDRRQRVDPLYIYPAPRCPAKRPRIWSGIGVLPIAATVVSRFLPGAAGSAVRRARTTSIVPRGRVPPGRPLPVERGCWRGVPPGANPRPHGHEPVAIARNGAGPGARLAIRWCRRPWLPRAPKAFRLPTSPARWCCPQMVRAI